MTGGKEDQAGGRENVVVCSLLAMRANCSVIFLVAAGTMAALVACVVMSVPLSTFLMLILVAADNFVRMFVASECRVWTHQRAQEEGHAGFSFCFLFSGLLLRRLPSF